VNWSDGSYWGEPGKMKFRTRIDNFTDATEVSDRERVVKTEFSITLHGYLLPEAFNDLVTTQKHLTPKRLVIKSETDLDISSIVKLEEGVQEVRVSGKSASSQRIITDNPLIIEQGTGVTVSNSGTEWIGADRLVQNISIPQEVSTNSNVTFNQITASDSLHIGTTSLDLSETGVSGDWNVIGSLGATGNLSIDGNAIIQGDLTAQSYTSELVSSTVLYDSGSTKFGDDIGDTHQFTGSIQLSGSVIANEINLTSGVTISEISNDPTLADESQTAVPTEHAVKTYVDDKDSYLRKHFVKIASSIIGTSTASFTAATASAPTGMTSTSENDFLFFLNGQYMEHDALTIQQAGSTFYLKVDTDSIGYDLETDDEIISWGKFNS
jgi:hypothetical protein